MRHTYKRQTEDMLITHYIENSAVADLFDFELEYDMALEYLQIKADFRETILVNYKKAEKYCQEDHIYKFKFIYSILYNPCIFKAYRLLNVQT